MNYETIRLESEKQFSQELSVLFQADIIGQLLDEARVESESNPYLAFLRGQSFKITHSLAPRMHSICNQVQTLLQFEEPVEYFIRSSQDLNAGASPRTREGDPHLVVLNSAMLERFSDDEMRFIIGHELGHLISKNADLMYIMRFVFPESDSIPVFFKDKIETWGKLSEMSADRFGYIAMPDLSVCQSVFFKLSSGLDTERIEFNPSAYRESLNDLLEAFEESGDLSGTSHPINPIRLKALEYFADSDLFRSVSSGGGTIAEDEVLSENLRRLVEILVTKGTSELAMHRKIFLASSGILVAGIDRELAREEVEHIISILANTAHFPRRLVDRILESENVGKLFEQSALSILKLNPGERWPMLTYMINIATADRVIRKEEVDLLQDVGEYLFQIPRKEVAQAIANSIQSDFVPQILAELQDK